MTILNLLSAGFSAIFAGLPSNDIYKLFQASYAMAPGPDKKLDILEEWTPSDKWTFLDSSGLDPQYDYDFTNVEDDGKIYMRGGHQYHRPYGWNRIALKVHGKYSEGDEWLGPNGIRTKQTPNEWAVSYHGTKAEHVPSIIKEGFKAGPRAKFGPGIYAALVQKWLRSIMRRNSATREKTTKLPSRIVSIPLVSKSSLLQTQMLERTTGSHRKATSVLTL